MTYEELLEKMEEILDLEMPLLDGWFVPDVKDGVAKVHVTFKPCSSLILLTRVAREVAEVTGSKFSDITISRVGNSYDNPEDFYCFVVPVSLENRRIVIAWFGEDEQDFSDLADPSEAVTLGKVIAELGPECLEDADCNKSLYENVLDYLNREGITRIEMGGE